MWLSRPPKASNLALNPSTPAERNGFLNEVEEFNRATSESASKYQAALYMDEDRRNFKIYANLLSEYQKLLLEAVALVKSNHDAEARKLLRSQVIPAFRRCMAQADKLLEYNVSLGAARGQEMLKNCERTQYLFAGLGTALFAAGFLLALFKYVFFPMFEKT